MKYKKYDAMQNLNGSNHVYFCSTGNDLTRFFNSVIEELFMFHKDIVFWYPEYYEENEQIVREALDPEDLLRMRMLVVPVTSELLNTDNASKREMLYAADNGVPVLPLIMEPGLDEAFSTLGENMHYLDKQSNKSDESQLAYEEKLRLFLDKTLSHGNKS